MQLHGPKRVYNASALEFWFDQLTSSWEPHFSGEILKMGRRLYRDGMIRGIELGEKDAIVHSKHEGREIYAVIEWIDGKPSTRSSIEETSLGTALAVAGLYEIEEMIVEEISPLPASKTEEEKEEPEKRRKKVAKAKQVEERGRPLHLVFQVETEGLAFKAEWSGENGERVPALAQGGNQNLLPDERERIIRLASLARRGDFQFSQKKHRYVLRDLKRISGFLKHELQPWRKFFTIELDPSVENLTEGIREVVVEARAHSRSSGALNLEWIFRTGEKLFSPEETDQLLKRKGEVFLSPEAGLVQLSSEKIEAVREWQQRVFPKKGEEVPKYMLLSLFAEKRIELKTDDDLLEWREKLLQPPAKNRKLPEFLRNYQREGVEWMAHLLDLDCHALLADEMGLGKTVQVISLLATRSTPEKKDLVVAPASVIPVWEKELARFFPEIKVHILRSGSTFAEEGSDGIWLASYTQLRRHSELLPKTEFGYAVLDEGQMIKNPTAKITRACFSIQARHRLVLTGTPLENRRLDLWSLFHFLMPNLLGTRAAFEKAATRDLEKFLHRLRTQLAPFVLRRTKQKVAKELPPKIEVVLASPLTSRQKDEYARICREGLQRLGEDLPETMRQETFGVLSLLTRLRQVSCDPGLLPWSNDPWKQSGKIVQLLEKLPEIIEEGRKVVIFSQFVALLKRVGQALEEVHPDLKRFELTGATIDRQKPVGEFQEFEGPAVMLISLRAGGTGITLHAADYVFLLDPWWNPAVEAQAIDRIHRIGQTNTVFVYRMVAAGTVEERVQDLKEEKQDLFESVIGGLDGLSGLVKPFGSLRSLIELDVSEEGRRREKEKGKQ